ncbi:RNA polymerase subunit sigma-70 [Knoellia sinensis KCTC 19936]|uniref:RNA polymerase subunit sigma-70 n=1 Tax=Knoellia sinensis KCTC 19936 TaxID=1385520 RepID=A0A0A0J0X2_9MICO|nr:SigE family RNA polymerase sigma factor [Knoellia sinensis]KGN31005.1 RNA polymerase subunit sigma-70 [Knoellia sinensis KCTC 19936]
MSDSDLDADFTAYVRARQSTLVRFAYLLTGDAQEAEDLVQSALANVYRRWSTIDGSPDAYVRRTMVNEHHSWWRRAWRHREVTGSDLVEYQQPAARPDDYGEQDLRAQIRKLPTQQRASIVLRYYEDRSEAETAEILGCSIGTVKSHTSRALAALRITMKEVASS